MESFHLAPVAVAWISKSEGREGGGGGSAMPQTTPGYRTVDEVNLPLANDKPWV